jgi:20S proteasome alpha/beta subunit
MTVGIGFVCSDGIVMCADSEESIGCIAKTSTGKIETLTQDGLSVGVIGSGDAGLGTMARQRLIRALAKTINPSMEEVEKVIEGFNRHFFKNYLLPYPASERPSVSLIVGVWIPREHWRLFRIESFSVCENQACECIGVGSYFTNVAHDLYRPDFDVDKMAKVAIFFMQKAKRGIQGCGGNTHVVLIKNSERTVSWLKQQDVLRIEVENQQLEQSMLRSFTEQIGDLP